MITLPIIKGNVSKSLASSRASFEDKTKLTGEHYAYYNKVIPEILLKMFKSTEIAVQMSQGIALGSAGPQAVIKGSIPFTTTSKMKIGMDKQKLTDEMIELHFAFLSNLIKPTVNPKHLEGILVPPETKAERVFYKAFIDGIIDSVNQAGFVDLIFKLGIMPPYILSVANAIPLLYKESRIDGPFLDVKMEASQIESMWFQEVQDFYGTDQPPFSNTQWTAYAKSLGKTLKAVMEKISLDTKTTINGSVIVGAIGMSPDIVVSMTNAPNLVLVKKNKFKVS